MRKIINAAKFTLNRWGVDFSIQRYPVFETLPFYIEKLGINLVLDVGANEGQFGCDLRAAGYKGRILSFEPGELAFERLEAKAANDKLWMCRNCGLSSIEREAKLNVSENSVFSSLLKRSEDADLLGYGSPSLLGETVQLKRLDTVWPDLDCDNSRILLKTDTQGHDLSVIDGAGEYLEQICAIQMEMAFRPMYSDQASVDAVLARMRDSGFVLIGLWKVCSSPITGELLEVDALFNRLTNAPQAIGRTV